MDVTALGLWIAGVGAVGAVAEALMQPPSRGSGGLTFSSPESARIDRLRHAVRLISAVFVAVGSALFAAASLRDVWVLPVTAAIAFAAVWGICAWSQYRVWRHKLAEAERITDEERQRYPMMDEQYLCARHCARLSWALRHPFNGQSWPTDFTRRRDRFTTSTSQ